jgi:phosphate-selective porin
MITRFCSISFLMMIFLCSVTLTVSAQTKVANAETRSETGSLRTEDEAQNEEIKKLREELRKEREFRGQQQAVLESLVKKLDDLAAAVNGPKAENRPVAPVVAENTTVSTAATNPDGATAKPQDKPVNAVEAGFGKIEFTGLIQGWFAAGDRGFGDTFRIRRAELRFSGQILPEVKWSVMFDPAKALSLNSSTTTINGVPVIRTVGVNQASRIFQEAFITLGYFKRANIQVGQFKIPLSQEGLQSSSALDTVERALFMSDRSRGGGLGDARDLGIMAFGALGKQLDYQIGIFNGAGETQNDVDANDEKAFAGRFVFKPSAIKGLAMGTSGAWAPRTQTLNPQHHRVGFEAVYQRDKLRLKSELMLGIDGDVHRRGYYAHAGYRFRPKVEGIFRVDTFDPNTRLESTSATVTERDYIGGINYYIRENNFKLQLNYLRKTFANGVTPPRNLFIVNLQTAW